MRKQLLDYNKKSKVLKKELKINVTLKISFGMNHLRCFRL